MTYVFKISGAVLLLFAALIISREYENFGRRCIRLTEGFLLMLEDIRAKVDCFLTPEGELLSDFENEALSECGYLETARGEGISDAYFKCEKGLSLPDDIKKLLSGVFRNFGREYREGTLRLLDSGIASLKTKLFDLKAEKEKTVKLVRTASLASALGIVILMI